MRSMSISKRYYVQLTYYAKLCDWSGRQNSDSVRLLYNHKRTQKRTKIKAMRSMSISKRYYVQLTDYAKLCDWAWRQNSDSVHLIINHKRTQKRTKIKDYVSYVYLYMYISIWIYVWLSCYVKLCDWNQPHRKS